MILIINYQLSTVNYQLSIIKMSYAKEHLKKVKQIKSDVMGITGMSDALYELHFFETGCDWADAHCVNVSGAEYLKSEHIFWGWWASEWAKISEKWFNERLMVDLYDGLIVAYRRADGSVKYCFQESDFKAHYLATSRLLAMDCRCQKAVIEGSFHRNLIKAT